MSRWNLAMLVLALSLGCTTARANSRSAASAPERELVTAAELTEGQWTNLYDALLQLRPLWLTRRGPDSILGSSTEVQVRLDETWMGGVEALRTVPPTGLASVRYVDPIAAAGRWGGAFAGGAILITTLSRR